ncbi:MAG TPA: 16S rRNA (cytosine(1402)-N(4))-methyltransferase RsmH [Spirochaetota bacterium]|mgnify:CR=1 FL=1|nr:16S rRNA (cytosine(1402)-N(4))-methyltransferase RsmH [Spirochaetota bacterium]HOL56648.1 16S rRNA (cytosine(1402)-N(4))-methyltransferase RsmH [Spirochaetota bacterium]HPP04203.1 16S rRNA (cytosine(1402)-N(4))-methyltransferase RsmH [Spirochaetota bacterium]
MNYVHSPVLVNEILSFLIKEEDRYFIDCTVGEGGHSEAILNKFKNITVYGLDRDKNILSIAKERLKIFGTRFIPLNINFTDVDKLDIDFKFCSGLMDLGISSYHYKVSEKGFTFLKDEKLDMRLSEDGLSVKEILNKYDFDRLVEIFYKYGEERFSKEIAKNIIKKRGIKPIETTFELVEIVERSVPKKFWPKNINVATKIFQALRIEANNEIENIKIGLPKILSLIKKGGRLGVITFHSVEDRTVKEIFSYMKKECICPKEMPVCVCNKKKEIEIISKPIQPSSEEIKNNPASRSAKLRIVEKIV